MDSVPSHTTTQILSALRIGDPGAAEKLWSKVYDDLHALAVAALRRERSGHVLQPTALVNEAYLRLAEQSRVQWKSREHFFAIAAQIIRRVLVDHARAVDSLKRGGGMERIQLEDLENPAPDDADASSPGLDPIALDNALTELALLSDRQARVVELKFFAGLDTAQTALVLGVSERTVKSDWSFAKAWLRRRLQGRA